MSKMPLLRGVSKFFLVQNHLLRNSLPAIATGLSLTLVYLLTGSLIVEEVFSWNGVGSLFVDAVCSLWTCHYPVLYAFIWPYYSWEITF